MTEDGPSGNRLADPRELLRAGFEKALEVQQPFAANNVARLRRVNPGCTPKQLVKKLDRYFLTAVTSTGAASGASAVVPGAGVPLALVDVMAFTEASVLYVLSLAEIHGLDPEDLERRKLLVMTVLLGDGATTALSKAVGRTGSHWAKRIVSSIPMKAINQANRVLGPRFITKYGTQQGVLVLSKQVPLGIGAVLGGGGNHLIGRGVVASARKIFGPAPGAWLEAPEIASETSGL